MADALSCLENESLRAQENRRLLTLLGSSSINNIKSTSSMHNALFIKEQVKVKGIGL
jgi:hypothetical protein